MFNAEMNRPPLITEEINDCATLPLNSSIMIKNEGNQEDMFLFNEIDLDSFSDVTKTFSVMQDLEISNNNPALSFQQPSAAQSATPKENTPNRFAVDLSGVCKLEGIENETTTPHYIKFKFQDGKHVKIWECGICGKEFGHQYTLMRHLPTHTDVRKFQCNTCGKAFRQMSTLSQHRAIHSSKRPFVCDFCQKTFNRISTLISHKKTHNGMKPHRCHLCNKAFHQKGNLRNHIFTHTNERPYKCDICNKGFNQMSNLMCHKLKAHQRPDKAKYACTVCHVDFNKRSALRNHEQYHNINATNQVFDLMAPNNCTDPNAIMVEPIKTEAMKNALEANRIPFALLRPLSGIPVLVKVLPAGNKQLLVAASADDLKKNGHISITPKELHDKENLEKALGNTVQIRIPVVATIIQQSNRDGQFSMSVESPGPNEPGAARSDGNGDEKYYYTSIELLPAGASGSVEVSNDQESPMPMPMINKII